MLLDFLPRFAADDDGGSGGTGDPPEGKIKPSDILNRYGNTAESALRMAEKLSEAENANYRLRTKNRDLTTERDALQSRQPADGGRVLTKAEADAYDAYVALGKKPGEVKAELDAAATATQELTTLRRKAQLHDVHALTGFDPDVLEDIGPSWEFVTKEESGAKVVYVKEGDTEQRIDQHPKVVKFMPALKPAQQQADPPARNTSFIQQHGGTAPAGDMAAQFIKAQEERRKAQPNPLLKGA
jgi:hypothetical protein